MHVVGASRSHGLFVTSGLFVPHNWLSRKPAPNPTFALLGLQPVSVALAPAFLRHQCYQPVLGGRCLPPCAWGWRAGPFVSRVPRFQPQGWLPTRSRGLARGYPQVSGLPRQSATKLVSHKLGCGQPSSKLRGLTPLQATRLSQAQTVPTECLAWLWRARPDTH